MARLYLHSGDSIQGLFGATYVGNGHWEEPELVEGATMRTFREDASHPDGGEWVLVRYDFERTPDRNPHYGELYFDDEEPDY